MRVWVLSVFVTVLLCIIFGCARDDLVGIHKANQAPQVWLSSAPPEGTVAEYTLHLFWGGWDPDGEIAYYEYVITDNEDHVFDPADTTGADKWHRVYENDSTFIFTADILADSTNLEGQTLKAFDFIRSHTFFIRAVDDQGLASPRPAYRSFTARTLSPIVDILVPRQTGGTPAQVPPISTFRWRGTDFIGNEREVQEPDSVRWIIVSTKAHGGNFIKTTEYIRANPDAPEWSDWHFYRSPGDTGKTWTTNPLEFGSYVFAVQVKDEAGAVNPVFDTARNVRRLIVATRRTGPELTVYNKFIGTMVTMNPNSLPVIVDLPARVPLEFRLSADASVYGGVASGYRYGWDIQDLSDDSQWDIDYTPFVLFIDGVPTAHTPSRTFEFDTHTMNIEVIDNNGFKSRITVTVNVIPFAMRKNVLVIDDWEEKSAGFAQSNGVAPNDQEHDEFWMYVLSNLRDFDPDFDMIEAEDELPIQAVADYKSIIWCTYGGYNIQRGISLLPEFVKFVPEDPALAGEATGKVRPNLLALYMEAGGHLLLCGEQPMTAVVNPDVIAGGNRAASYPLIFRYELTGDQDGEYEDSDVGNYGVGELSFAYHECCLNVLDISALANKKYIRRVPKQSCSVHQDRFHNQRTDGLRFTIPVEDTLSLPALELRWEVADPGREYSPERRGLVNDVYNPPYFQSICDLVAETDPRRECFQPMYGHGCLDASSKIYDAPVAFWTSTFGERVPDTPGGVAARSVIWGFPPVYFNPDQVKEAIELILEREWKLPVDRPDPPEG